MCLDIPFYIPNYNCYIFSSRIFFMLEESKNYDVFLYQYFVYLNTIYALVCTLFLTTLTTAHNEH